MSEFIKEPGLEEERGELGELGEPGIVEISRGRLTAVDDCGNWCLKGMPWKKIYPGIQMITEEESEILFRAFDRLKDYEETGLTPEEVERMKEGNRWVTDCLPPEGEPVLVHVSGWPLDNIELVDAFLLATYNREEGWIMEDYPKWKNVQPVAWRLLPEPYRR